MAFNIAKKKPKNCNDFILFFFFFLFLFCYNLCLQPFQAWLDLESGGVDLPIFESGSYSVTSSNLSRSMQRAETFLALVESRRKQLDTLRVEAADIMNPDITADLVKCEAQLEQVECRYAKKRVCGVWGLRHWINKWVSDSFSLCQIGGIAGDQRKERTD